MAGLGIAFIFVYIGVGIIAFCLIVLFLRWVFGIGKIIDLLTDISNSLRMRKVVNPAPISTSPQQAASTPTNVHSFGILQSELSLGDWIANPDGERFQIVNFRGKDLIVKQGDGTDIRISPPFYYRKA
jgi:hypothetical protein